MNPVHDSKDCHNTMSQQAPVAVESSPEPTYSGDTSNEHARAFSGYSHTNQQQASPNMHQQQDQYHHQQQQESEANRLPGMIAHSQPGTPRPENGHTQQEQQQEAPVYQAPPAIPFPTRNNVRGRSRLFALETGPNFTQAEAVENLYASDKSSLLQIRIESKMDRGFFMADNDWTCYRRNYFQLSSVFSIHGFNQYYADPQQPQQVYVQGVSGLLPVTRFLLGVSARVVGGDKDIELIQHTPKRDKGPQFRPDPKPISPGGNLTMSSVASNQNVATFERLQFKTATANNGKRRAAQQYYICAVDLYADTDRGQMVKVATCHSAPLVVRGRSPGHYAEIQVRGNNAIAVASNTQQQRQQGDQPLQHVFSSYQKPMAQQSEPPTMPPVMSHEYSGPNTPYPYYHQAPTQYQYAPTSNVPTTGNNSNVSSPISHPPLPSPYTHHAQVPHYAIHDASHNDPYANELQNNSNNGSPQQEEHKMMHHLPFHMQQSGPIESPHSGYDWQRARYNSSSSGSSSAPSPGVQHAEATYFTPHHHSSDTRSSTYSPTTPTYSNATTPGGQAAAPRKYTNNNAVPTLMNKQIS